MALHSSTLAWKIPWMEEPGRLQSMRLLRVRHDWETSLSSLQSPSAVILEKEEEPEIKLPTSTGSWKKQESSRKTSISALSTIPKPLIVWITINYGKFWKRWEYQTIWPVLRNLYADQEATVRTGHGTTDWFQIGRGVHQGCILSPCLFNLYAEYIMGWKKHKLELRLPGEISITSGMQMTPPLWQKVKRN